MQKINAAQATVEYSGPRFKHIAIALGEGQEIAEALGTPEAWAHVQADWMKALGRGDTVTVISSDGTVIADRAMVTRAEGGRLWFSAPQRMVTLEQVSLFEDALHEVTTVGTGYSIKHKRDGRVEDRIFSTVEGARAELGRRQPQRV